MKKFYIPEIGDEIILAEDWNFTLYPERRNVKLGFKIGVCVKGTTKYSYDEWLDKTGKNLGYHPCDWNRKEEKWDYKITYPFEMKKGTKLKIDRIYIRKGNKEYSSISFWVKTGEFKGARFWAKLSDANKINFDFEPTQEKLNL